MKFLVNGCGSIGKRHIGNLKALSAGDVIASDVRMDRCKEVEKAYGIKTYVDIEEALDQKPDAVLIATPTSLHLTQALAAAKRGCHLFIEKPLSHSLDGVDELLKVVAQKNLVTLVGCNMRFHHSVLLMKELLDKRSIGKIISARLQAGQYLPDWHPWEDYRQGYSANINLGGGTILDGVHQIDYISWFLGEVTQVFCFAGKFSSLEINTEDMAEILLRFNSGAIAEVHLDYIQRFYSHSCQIIGEEGTILWDFSDKQVKMYSAKTKEWQLFQEEPGYDINQMYIEEMKYFLRCIEKREQPINNEKEAKRVLEIALAAKESARTGKIISL